MANQTGNVQGGKGNIIKPTTKTKSKLAGALMRTFRGDITKELGNKAPEIVEKLIPASQVTTTTTVEADKAQAVETIIEKPVKERGARPDSLLHTYKGDVQELVKRRKLSLMRMAADEADRKDGPKYELGHTKTMTRPSAVLIMVLTLVVLGVFSLAGAYYVYILREQAGVYQPPHTSLIFTESVETINTTGKSARMLKQELTRMRVGGYYSFGSVIEFLPVRQITNTETGAQEVAALSAGELLDAFEAVLPKRFVDVFHNKFMLGLYATKENMPFLILQTSLYDYAFEGMLTWENALEQDLAPLFSPGGKYAEPAIFSGAGAFTDTVINNLDVRILRDKENKVRLLYSFVNKNTLLITTDVQAFVELAGRLRVAQ